ncbi:DUF6603 domain-containing protein [Algoriphagus sp. D3-2-R+10]|uniref:DUF6603 domain-containing protein n=1 Tax=Algoriphagus aurantiacus TaxID=3103948 RepID=UPI002B3DDF4F|nr:DUF6603 domain-containing protein [Algoriphagus sp. D3-2-R+10]MEB2777396.1 DUF6603 domain-containing protein [Algoriphagus sp. D3-2-R+10]
MGKLSRLINHINDWFAPFEEFCKDENFRGELFASVGAKEPTDASKKARFEEKRGKLMGLLQALKDKFDVDEIEVGNLVAFGKLIAEMYVVSKTMSEMLEECSYQGVDENDNETKEIAIVNAIRAISKYFSFVLFRNKAPEIAAFGEALGIFSDEYNETKRALDLALVFDLVRLVYNITQVDSLSDISGKDTYLQNPSITKAGQIVGDPEVDFHQHILKGIFLDLSVLLTVWLNGKAIKYGEFLVNFGHEGLPDLDFPRSAELADRVLQLQFLPGEKFGPDGALSELTDSIISFGTIPIPSDIAQPNSEPAGYQYLMKVELSATEIGFDNPENTDDPDSGIDLGDFQFRIPANVSRSFIWGHDIEFDGFSSDLLGVESFLELVLPAPHKKPTVNSNEPEEIDLFDRGEISLKIAPKKVFIKGEEKADLEFRLEMRDFVLAVSGEDRDGFLQKILPDEAQLRASFSLAYSPRTNSWSLDGLDGRDGLFFMFKIGKVGFKKSKTLRIEIPALYFGLSPLVEKVDSKEIVRGLELEASIGLRLGFGPLDISADRLGLLAKLTFPEKADGNLMGADLNLDLKPPSGVGFLLKGKYLSGGGFLYIDADRGEYMGIAQLSFKSKYNIKAFGIILTKLPNGKNGFSFVLMLTVETSFQLGLGFQLTGVGGLVGINRRVEISKLQEGMRSNLYDDILFPKNPMENPYGLLNAINTVFPAEEGQFVIGLLLQIAWGPKGLISIEAGFIVEFPEPVRLTIIGVLKALVQKKVKGKEITALNLQCNFLGIFDFEKQFIRLDAVLFNSTLCGLKLDGDLALRIRYNSNPDFVLSVGGFHPNFQPPSLDLPAEIKRLQIILRSGNPSVIVSAYVAVTSNTFQFGVAGVLKFEKWGVKILGELSFDALFQFSPFCFEVSVHFLLSASWKGYEFAAIELNGLFAGPSPWHVEGSLRLKVWIFSKTVHLDESWGDEDATRLESIRILPLLTADLQNQNNWEAKSGSTRVLTTVRKQEGRLLLHPNELLVVRQNTVPLSLNIDKFGERVPEGGKKFNIQFQDPEGKLLNAQTVKNHFAPAQFVNMRDEQKLSSSSYELFDSGLSFEGLDEIVCSEMMSTSELEYETKIVDVPTVAPIQKPFRIKEHAENFAFGLKNNAIANSTFGRKTKSVIPESAPLREHFTVVDKAGLTTFKNTHAFSETEALQKLMEIEKSFPRKKGQLMVLLND